ncbi:MAG: nucleotidyltransferase domain-containing protein [Nitrososphaeria archaeon]
MQKKILPDARTYVFGSAIKDKAAGGSDVDILIVSKNIPSNNIERAKLKVKIEELSNLPPYHPFELHLADENQAKWYFTKIKELEEI